MSKIKRYQKSLSKLRDHLDQYLASMKWAESPKYYAYMMGLVKAHNMLCDDLCDPISQVPEEPEVWLEQGRSLHTPPNSGLVLFDNKIIV